MASIGRAVSDGWSPELIDSKSRIRVVISGRMYQGVMISGRMYQIKAEIQYISETRCVEDIGVGCSGLRAVVWTKVEDVRKLSLIITVHYTLLIE